MGLSGFNHRVQWREFRLVSQRPANVQEDAYIYVAYRNRWRYQQSGNSCRIVSVNSTLSVSRSRSWFVRGQQSADLLRHEQGHYDITALGVREMYNRISSLSASTCSDVDREAGRIQSTIQQQIAQKNRRYDNRTNHGTNASVQQTWNSRIASAKQSANGTLANLPWDFQHEEHKGSKPIYLTLLFFYCQLYRFDNHIKGKLNPSTWKS